MITIEKTFPLKLNYDLSLIGDPEKILFFDIETTGLSASTSQLYLIGALFIREDHFVFRQYFAESLGSEQEVLKNFFDLCADFDVLLHFNGDHFDIPYLETIAREYGLSTPFSELRSYDIYRTVRHHQHFYGFDNYRQKTIEAFLKIEREDRYNGGELISVYHEYEKTGDSALLELLLIHNEEDLLGMPGILPILTYRDALSGNASFTLSEAYRNKSASRLFLTLRFPFFFPINKDCEYDGVLLHFEDDCLYLSLPLYYGTLKYFYPNYRDYYYLPKEDTAIHRKISQFVDPAYREKATPETCYHKMEGFFIPAVKNSGLPAFQENYRDTVRYHRYEQETLPTYLHALLSEI